MIRIITIEYDVLKKGFDDSDLTTFLSGKSVINIKKRFFKHNSRFYWTFAIEYEAKKSESVKDIELSTEVQKTLLMALKEWRNELASEKGIPPYLIFTNNQLRSIVLEMPDSIEKIKSVSLISSKKAQEYGEIILKIIRENIPNEQESAIPDFRTMV